MPHLQTLDGQPLSWPELLRRNAEWHETHDRNGNAIPVLPSAPCYWCKRGRHSDEYCTGRAKVDYRPVACECSVNGHAA